MSEPEKEKAPVVACFVVPAGEGKLRLAMKVVGFAVASVEDGPEGVVLKLGEPSCADTDFTYSKVLPED